jgi:hypothetical protein
MKRSSFQFWIRSYFLSHPVVQAIEPVVRYRKGNIHITSLFFAPGLKVVCRSNSLDILFEADGVLIDFLRSFSLEDVIRIQRNRYVSLYDVHVYSEKSPEPRYVSSFRAPTYPSRRAIYIKKVLDRLLEGIVSKKFLKPVKWLNNDDVCTACFAGDTRIGKDSKDCNWSYPLYLK